MIIHNPAISLIINFSNLICAITPNVTTPVIIHLKCPVSQWVKKEDSLIYSRLKTHFSICNSIQNISYTDVSNRQFTDYNPYFTFFKNIVSTFICLKIISIYCFYPIIKFIKKRYRKLSMQIVI